MVQTLIKLSQIEPFPTITTEDLQDAIGNMVTGNVETGIDVTYDDTAGKLNFDAQTAGDARYTQRLTSSTTITLTTSDASYSPGNLGGVNTVYLNLSGLTGDRTLSLQSSTVGTIIIIVVTAGHATYRCNIAPYSGFTIHSSTSNWDNRLQTDKQTVILVSYSATNMEVVATYYVENSNSFVINQAPVSGAVDGTNNLFTFTTAGWGFVPGSLQLYRDGQLLTKDIDYTEYNPDAGTVFTTTAPAVGSVMRGTYQQAHFSFGNADTVDGYHAADLLLNSTAANTGWWQEGSTATRTGNYTFTFTKDGTTRYRRGTKVRWKDGAGYKYGVVISSSYTPITTTVTLIPTTDYLMAAATITDFYYSYSDNPEDFPTRFNYAPTVDASGGGAWGVAPTVNIAWWSTFGKMGYFYVDFTINNIGAKTGTVTYTTPWNAPAAIGVGREAAVTGSLLSAICNGGTVTVLAYNNGGILTAGYRPNCSVTTALA